MTSGPTASRAAQLFADYRAQLRELTRGTGLCHGVGHAARVAALAEVIALAEDCPVDLAVCAALFHDVGYASGASSASASPADHELRSVELTRPLLADRFAGPDLDRVLVAIEGRRFRKLGGPRDLVGAVLDDADNLDALGQSGVARAFEWLEEHRDDGAAAAEDLATAATADYVALRGHWKEKLSRLRGLMRTDTGRRLADARHEHMLGFLERMAGEQTPWATPE